MQFHLDFVRPQASMSGLGIALALVGIASFISILVWHQIFLKPDIAETEGELRHLQLQMAKPVDGNLLIREQDVPDELRRANAVRRSLGAPWDGLFAALEEGATNDVALLGVDPDVTKGEVTISGETRNLEALLNYVRYLRTQKVLQSVTLQSHTVVRNDRDHPVRFRLVAAWEAGK